jgi:hypothetical protein
MYIQAQASALASKLIRYIQHQNDKRPALSHSVMGLKLKHRLHLFPVIVSAVFLLYLLSKQHPKEHQATMADWPRWTSRQLLCFLSCAQFIIPLISVAPMEQLPTSAANAPGVYAAMHHTEPDAIPEGYSLVQTAQPGFHAVWRPFNVIVPAVVDYGGYEFHPGTLVTNQLVPNNNYQAPSHQRDRPVLREHAKPFNPSHSQEDQGRLPNRKPYKEKGPKRIGESASVSQAINQGVSVNGSMI